MNVIVANQQKEIISNLDIDILKSLDGEFDADEFVSMFQTFYFGKMILDVTAIKDYKNIQNIQKISLSLNVENIILLLPANDPDCTSNAYLSQLISMGIYNFTTSLDGIKYLLVHPNSYRDVAHIQQFGQASTPQNPETVVVTQVVESGEGRAIVLGFKNMTEHAGATSLIYMLYKELVNRGVPVVALEVNKRDFQYFNDKGMISITKEELPGELLKNSGMRAILIDLNDSNSEGVCSDVFYLIEPSTIKLNRLMRKDRNIFEKMKGKHLVLNKSLLSTNDVSDLEFEAKAKMFFALPPLNDRIHNEAIDNFLGTIGLIRTGSQSSKNGVFNIFNKS